MKISFIQKLACPFDKNELSLSVIKQIDNEIHEGVLTCPVCERYYPIVYGIPIMSPDEYREPLLEEPLLRKWGLQTTEKPGRFVLKSAVAEEIQTI
jgi:uncharacterized protein YbaR (Trm112 family)